LIYILFQGLGLGSGLIIAIGAQNAFVLRQGLKHEHHFIIATVCFLVDTVLIVLGGVGMGTLIASTPELATGSAIFGAAFLFVYGLLALRRAWGKGVPETQEDKNASTRMSLKVAILTTLGFSLLNPQVYLDTLVLLGGVSGQYPWPDRTWFLAGAIVGSLLWFYSLAFAATKLTALFHSSRAWRILDSGICMVMWAIAFSLIKPVLFPPL